MGISYGGFIAIEHARQFHDRLHTLTLSGIIFSREELFEQYEAISLRFYREGPDRMPQYRGVATPTLIMPGEQDRALPLWAQRKMFDIFPSSHWLMIPECGHVAYLERPDIFFPALKAFMRAKSTKFEAPATRRVATRERQSSRSSPGFGG